MEKNLGSIIMYDGEQRHDGQDRGRLDVGVGVLDEIEDRQTRARVTRSRAETERKRTETKVETGNQRGPRMFAKEPFVTIQSNFWMLTASAASLPHPREALAKMTASIGRGLK